VDSRTTEDHQREAQNKSDAAPRKKNENEEKVREKASPKNNRVAEDEQRRGQGEGLTI